MKKKLSAILLILTMITASLCVTVSAENYAEPAEIIYSEDFNEYNGEGTLPEGWKWTKQESGTTVSTSPAAFGYGNETALRITSEGSAVNYLGGTTESFNISEGVFKLSFQIYFETIGNNSTYSQVVHVYGGGTTPLLKGVRIDNGIVRYADYKAGSTSTRWTQAQTTSSMSPRRWYTFDIISDIDNNRAYYYMDGKPLMDFNTGEVVNTECYAQPSSETASGVHVLARTKHSSSEVGGDVFVDNISLTKGIPHGVYIKDGTELSENPEKLDIKFASTINLADFSASDVTAMVYAADDVMMQNGTPVSFEIRNLSVGGCQIVFDSTVDMEDYGKIKVDFGKNTDFTGGKLSYAYAVKVPQIVEPEPEVLYDSEAPDDCPTEINYSNVSKTEYVYSDNEGEKTSDLFTAGGNSSGYIELKRKDGEPLFDSGSDYEMTFNIKVLEGNYKNNGGKESSFLLCSPFDGTTEYSDGAVKWLYLSNRYRSIGYFTGEQPSVQAFEFDYGYTKDSTVMNDIDSLFEAQKWVSVKYKFYASDKMYDYELIGGNGKTYKKEKIPIFYSNAALNKTYESIYPDTDLSDKEVPLTGLKLTITKNSRVMFDDFKITKQEKIPGNARIKYIILKDENGHLLDFEKGAYEPGAKKIEVYFEGAIEKEDALATELSGNNVPEYVKSYNNVTKILTLETSDEGTLFGGESTYTLVLPETNVEFTMSAGKVYISKPVINITENGAEATLKVKNTGVSESNVSAFILAAYNGENIKSVTSKALSVKEAYSGKESVGLALTDDVDAVKAFVLDKNNIVHIVDYAEEKISDATDVTEHEYKYTGNTEAAKVTAVVMKPQDNDKNSTYSLNDISVDGTIEYIDVINSDKGEYTVSLDISGKSGRYMLYVADENGNMLAEKEILHSNDEDRSTAQGLLNSAAQESKEKVKEVISEYAVDLGLLGIDLYSDADKNFVAEKLYESVKENPIDTSNRLDTLLRVVDICLIEALNKGVLSDIAYYKDNSMVLKSEPFKTLYERNIADSKKVTKRLTKKALTTENFSDKLTEATALEIISAGKGYAYVKDVTELLENKIGVDASKGNAGIYRLLDGKTFADYTEYAEEFNRLVKEAEIEEAFNRKDNRNKNGKGGAIGNVSFSGITPTPAPTPLKDRVFSDLDGYEWAETAIGTLKEKNIIAGRTKNIFAPGENVLREEFTKMVVMTFDLKEAADISFYDVKNDDWFKPYLEKAVKAEVVTGEGDSFGAGKTIKRQDMAVIIYRALKNAGKGLASGETEVFEDYGDIAPYAVEAVTALYKAGIIKGKDNGKFEPEAFATRAETAVIIARAIALIG